MRYYTFLYMDCRPKGASQFTTVSHVLFQHDRFVRRVCHEIERKLNGFNANLPKIQKNSCECTSSIYCNLLFGEHLGLI